MYTYSIPSLGIPTDKELNAMPFGRQIEYIRRIQAWQEGKKKAYVSQKRQSFAKAIKEFKDLYQPSEWYTRTKPKNKSPNYYDDGIEIYYI